MGQLACQSPGELNTSGSEDEVPQNTQKPETSSQRSLNSVGTKAPKLPEKTKLKEKEFDERVRRMSNQMKYVRNFLMLEHWQKEGDKWVSEEVKGSQYTDITNSPRNPDDKPKLPRNLDEKLRPDDLKEPGKWEWVSDWQMEPEAIERAKKKVMRYRRYGVYEKSYACENLGTPEKQSLTTKKAILERSLEENRREAKVLNETIERLKRELDEAQRQLEKVEDDRNVSESKLKEVSRKLVDLNRSSEESHIHVELFEALRYLLWHTELFNRVNDELLSDDDSESASDDESGMGAGDTQTQLAKQFHKSDPKKKYFIGFQAKLDALSKESDEWYRHQRMQQSFFKKKGNMGDQRVANQADLEACKAIYDKLANRMRVAALRDRPYRKRDAHKIQVNDLLTRDVKLLTRTKCPFRIQELLILNAYLNMVNPPEESDELGSAFNRIEKLDTLYRGAVDGFEQRVYYRIDIKKKIEDTIKEIERRHVNPQLHEMEYKIQGFMTFSTPLLSITSSQNEGKIPTEKIKVDDMKRDMRRIMRAKWASDVFGLEKEEMLDSSAVKTAFNKLVKKYHPDKNKDERATIVFNKVSDAKQRLGISGYINFEFSPEFVENFDDGHGEFSQDVGNNAIVAPDVLERIKNKGNITPSASTMLKQEAEIIDNMLIMLEGWLEDFYPNRIPLVIIVFKWFRRMLYIEQSTRKHIILDTKNFSPDELINVESKIIKCFKKATEKHYKDIYAQRLKPYLRKLKKTSKDAKLNLADQDAKTHFNGFLDVFQKNVKYTVNLIARLKTEGLVTKPSIQPLEVVVKRIVSILKDLLPTIIAMKLVDDDGKPYDVLDKNAQEALQAATKVRQNMQDSLELTKLIEEDQFKDILKEFDWIESEIALRLENWIDVRCRNLGNIISRTVSKVSQSTLKRTLTGAEIDNLNVDAFTFLSQAVDNFMKTLRNLPASTAKNKVVLKSFFDRLTRLILVFVKIIKPELPKSGGSHKEKLLFSFKKKKNQHLASKEHIARFKDLGFGQQEIEFALSKGNTLTEALDLLLVKETTEVVQEKKVEEDRKHNDHPEDIDYCEVAQQVKTFDNIQDHVARLSNYIQKEINNLHPELKAIFPELCDSFSKKTGRWLREMIDALLPTICEKMIRDNLKAREMLYPADMLPESDCLQVLLTGLIELLENFNILRAQTYRSLLQSAIDLLCTEIEWIFRKSNRKFKRSWVVNVEGSGLNSSGLTTFLWGVKLETDLNDMQESFLDLGLSEDEIIKSTDSLKTLFIAMKQSSSSLVFQHIYLKLVPQLNKEKGVVEIEDERELLHDVLVHRAKSHAQSYVKLTDNKNIDILNEMRGKELFDKTALNSFYAPVPVSILMAIGLNNQAKLSRKTNPYIDIQVLEQNYKSKVKNDTLDPVWKDEGYIFAVPRDHFSRTDSEHLELVFEVRSERIGVKNNFLGIAKLILTAGHLGGIRRHTLRLQGRNFDYTEGVDRGQIVIEVDTKWIAEAAAENSVRESQVKNVKVEKKNEPSVEILWTPKERGETVEMKEDNKSKAKADTTNPFGQPTDKPQNPFMEKPKITVQSEDNVTSTNPFDSSIDTNPFHKRAVSDDVNIRTTISNSDNLFV